MLLVLRSIPMLPRPHRMAHRLTQGSGLRTLPLTRAMGVLDMVAMADTARHTVGWVAFTAGWEGGMAWGCLA